MYGKVVLPTLVGDIHGDALRSVEMGERTVPALEAVLQAERFGELRHVSDLFWIRPDRRLVAVVVAVHRVLELPRFGSTNGGLRGVIGDAKDDGDRERDDDRRDHADYERFDNCESSDVAVSHCACSPTRLRGGPAPSPNQVVVTISRRSLPAYRCSTARPRQSLG